MSYTKAIVRQIDPKTHELVLDNHVLGVSKTDFDARFHMHAINDALDVAYLEGQKYLEQMVIRKRLEAEIQTALFAARAEMERERIAYLKSLEPS